jgi:glycosyltransferase involved in cell wall biosynthesis
MLVSIIIPAYRQEKTITEDIERIYEVMSKTRFDFEIIVVIDGYVDKSAEEAKKIDKPNIYITGYENNRGKGYAIRYGMAKSKGQLVAFIDSGMDINPNGISIVLEHMLWYNADIIVGSKRHQASKVKYYSVLRKIYSMVYQMLVYILFGLKVKDTQTGLKVYKRNVLEVVLPRLLIKEFAFDIELLAVAYHLGFNRIYEAPIEIELRFSENSKIKRNRPLFLDPNIRKMLIDTFAVFYRIYILRYYDDKSQRKWVYDKELDMKLNTGEFS